MIRFHSFSKPSDKIKEPVNIYLFKVNNRNPRKRCEICSKILIWTAERHRYLWTCFISFSSASIVDYEQVLFCWEDTKNEIAHYFQKQCRNNELTKFTWKHLCQSLFLIKLQAEDLQLYQIRESDRGVFLWIFRNF